MSVRVKKEKRKPLAVKKGDTIILSDKAVELLAATPPSECWICDEILRNLKGTDEGYAVSLEWLRAQGFEEHLKQVVGDWDEE